MVGVAILKDFETGSYEKIRLTFYEGQTFEDIDRGKEFVSCTADYGKRKIVYDYGGLRHNPTSRQVFEICRRVRELWMDNEYITIVRFVYVHGEIRLRNVSEKLGVYDFPDKYSLFESGHTDVYKLVCDVRDRDILYISAMCEALNFGVESLFNVNYPMYFYASCGIYVNVFLYEACLEKRLVCPKEVRSSGRKAVKYYRFLIKKRKPISSIEQQINPASGTRHEIITDYREYKYKVMEYMMQNYPNANDFIINLPSDPFVATLTERFYNNACDFLRSMEGYFHAASHVRYITPTDMLSLVSSSAERDRIVCRSRAASANFKFQSKLPCPKFYDSRGRAYTGKDD